MFQNNTKNNRRYILNDEIQEQVDTLNSRFLKNLSTNGSANNNSISFIVRDQNLSDLKQFVDNQIISDAKMMKIDRLKSNSSNNEYHIEYNSVVKTHNLSILNFL